MVGLHVLSCAWRMSVVRRGWQLGIERSKREVFGSLAPDEPLFVLRAADVLAPEHVEAWAIEAELNGYPKQEIDKARRIARVMREWRKPKAKKLRSGGRTRATASR